MMVKLDGCIFGLDDDLLKKYNIVWKSDIVLKKNLKKIVKK